MAVVTCRERGSKHRSRYKGRRSRGCFGLWAKTDQWREMLACRSLALMEVSTRCLPYAKRLPACACNKTCSGTVDLQGGVTVVHILSVVLMRVFNERPYRPLWVLSIQRCRNVASYGSWSSNSRRLRLGWHLPGLSANVQLGCLCNRCLGCL